MSFKRVFPFLIAAAAAVFFVVSCGSDKQKQRIVEITKVTKVINGNPQMGIVAFPHDVHDAEGIKCVICHHKVHNDRREKVCAECHVGEEGMTAMHKLCLDCHISSKKGPRECDACHGMIIKKG